MTARTIEQRQRHALQLLSQEVDAWVATAGNDVPWLVPLSFLWDGARLLFATSRTSVTARNLLANGRVRLTVGSVRDVVVIEGRASACLVADMAAAVGDAFAAKTGFDPRRPDTPHFYFWVRPARIQAWRDEAELVGRDLMKNGVWLV